MNISEDNVELGSFTDWLYVIWSRSYIARSKWPFKLLLPNDAKHLLAVVNEINFHFNLNIFYILKALTNVYLCKYIMQENAINKY